MRALDDGKGTDGEKTSKGTRECVHRRRELKKARTIKVSKAPSQNSSLYLSKNLRTQEMKFYSYSTMDYFFATIMNTPFSSSFAQGIDYCRTC